MACFYPVTAYQLKHTDGTSTVQFKPFKGSRTGSQIQLPCGGCLGCRIDRSQMWALRCVHESQQHEYSSFVTLTYNDSSLNGERSLNKRDFKLFMKRLRKRLYGNYKSKISYFHCGEYGEVCKICGKSRFYCRKDRTHSFDPTLGRPHHHACIFGVDFDDKYVWDTRRGSRLYRSKMLEELWSRLILKTEVDDYDDDIVFKKGNRFYKRLGFCTVGDVNFKSAAYVARYCTKKITGSRSSDHYTVVNRETGEIRKCIPEYNTQSNRPALGERWFRAGGREDCFPKDFVTNNGRRYAVPRYYRLLLERDDPGMAERIKEKRRLTAETKGRKSLKQCRDTDLTWQQKMSFIHERRYENGSESL